MLTCNTCGGLLPHFSNQGNPRHKCTCEGAPVGETPELLNGEARCAGATGSGCLWTFEAWHSYYETACGNAYCFDDEFKPGKGYQYCPGCGKPITTSAAGKPDNEESSGQSETTLAAPSSPNTSIGDPATYDKA
jgi:hypothetical protein